MAALKTLADCRAYVLALPSREQAQPQAAVAVLLQDGHAWRPIPVHRTGGSLHGQRPRAGRRLLIVEQFTGSDRDTLALNILNDGRAVKKICQRLR